MHRNMKIDRIIPLGFGVILVLMSTTILVSQRAKNTLVQSANWVLHTYEVELGLNNLEKDLLNAETGQRGFIFTGNPNYLEPYNNRQKKFYEDLVVLKALLRDNSNQVTRVEKIQELA